MSNVFEDALTKAVSFDITDEIVSADRLVHRDLERYCNCPYPNTTLAGTAEVQSITSEDATDGFMDLIFTLEDGQTFTITLAYDAFQSIVQSAVNNAAALTIDGYVADDIDVSGGPFASGGSTPTIFTFSGISVHGNHPLIVVDGAALTGGAADPVPSQTTPGGVARFWFAALKAMGVIVGSDPAFGATPAGQYTIPERDEVENYPNNDTIKRLINEASIQEDEDWNSELLPLLNLK